MTTTLRPRLRVFSERASRIGEFLVVASISLFLLGCAGRQWNGFPAPYADAPVWPPAPESPRVAYVMEVTNHRDLYDVAGFWSGVARVLAGPADSRLVRPFGVALHPSGGLLVSDPGRSCVHYFDWSRERYVAIGADVEGGLPSPLGLAVLPGGDILVSDSRRATIERFDRAGDHLGAFIDRGILKRPAGMAFSAARGELMVADVTDHSIAVFDTKGNPLRRIGQRGDRPGQFNFPTHLALDSDDALLVTDSMNFRIQRLTPSGEPIDTYGELGDSPGHFSKAQGVSADARGRIVAVEGLYDTIQFFRPDGQLLLSLGQPGSEPGEFWLPKGLAIDRDSGLMFVADSYNSRIQVFRILDGLASE